MSNLFKNISIPKKTIDILKENGINTRTFSKVPHVPDVDDYTACMFLTYTSETILPKTNANYRNHFCLYTNDQSKMSEKSIIIVRSETSLIFPDTDAILQYQKITPITTQTVRECQWDICYDKIKYNNEKPKSFKNFYLNCSGEWWYFDKGVILNGTYVDKQTQTEYTKFIYYELKPKFAISKTQKTQTPQLVLKSSNEFSDFLSNLNRLGTTLNPAEKTTVTDIPTKTTTAISEKNNTKIVSTNETNQIVQNCHTKADELQTETIDVLPSNFTNYFTLSNQSIITQNYSTKVLINKYQCIIPSLFWLNQRNEELKRKDLSYFEARNEYEIKNYIKPNYENAFSFFDTLF